MDSIDKILEQYPEIKVEIETEVAKRMEEHENRMKQLRQENTDGTVLQPDIPNTSEVL